MRKSLEMRFIIFLVALLSFYSGISQKTYKLKKTVLLESGIRVFKKNKKPCTGVFISTNENSFKVENYYLGKLHGISTEKNQYRVTIKEVNYKNGLLHGVSKEWDRIGFLIDEKYYLDGYLDGVSKHWDTLFSKEKFYFENTYKNGVLTKRKVFINLITNKLFFYEAEIKSDLIVSIKISGKLFRLENDFGGEYFSGSAIFPSIKVVSDYTTYHISDLIFDEFGLIKNGRVMKWAKDSVLIESKHYSDTKLNGRQQEFYQDGQPKSDFFMINDLREGSFKMWFNNGQIEVDQFYKNGELVGIAKSWYENGQIASEENYEDGKIDGLSKGWYENGQIAREENYNNGQLNELSKGWYENGQIAREEYFTKGLKQNTHKYWYENGQQKEEINYLDDKLNGSYRVWYEDGKKKIEGFYLNNLSHNTRSTYFENGTLDSLISYKFGLKNGIWKTYYSNGKQKNEISYLNNKKDGVEKNWDQFGEIKEINFYKNNIKNGICKSWYDKKLIYEGQFLNGEESYSKQWDYNYFDPESEEEYSLEYIEINYKTGLEINRIYYSNNKLAYEKIVIDDNNGGSSTDKYFYRNGQLESEEKYVSGSFIYKNCYNAVGKKIKCPPVSIYQPRYF